MPPKKKTKRAYHRKATPEMQASGTIGPAMDIAGTNQHPIPAKQAQKSSGPVYIPGTKIVDHHPEAVVTNPDTSKFRIKAFHNIPKI